MAKTENTTEYSCTRITPTMIVSGNVSSSDNLLIEGQVFGNISTSADVTASNLIVGDLKARNVALNSARIKGNLDMSETLAIGRNTIIIGDISADAFKLSGKVRGNVFVNESALLTETALLVGNITAEYVTTQTGARISGSITTTADKNRIDIESEFDLGDISNKEEGGDY